MKILILGAGSMGTRRAQYLAQPELELEVHVYDVQEDRAHAIRGATAVTWEQVEDAADYEAAVVATPPETHVEYARRLLRMGTAALLIEKPLAANLDMTETLLTDVTNADAVTMMGQTLRWHKDIQELRAMVLRGDLGPLVHLTAHFGHRLEAWEHPDPVGTYTNGALVDAATHELDLITWLAGADVEWVMGDAWRTGLFDMELEDVADVVLGLGNGAHATVHVDLADLTYRRNISILGGDQTAQWYWRPDERMYGRETRAFLAAAYGAELPHDWPDVARGRRVLQLAMAARQSDGRAIRV